MPLKYQCRLTCVVLCLLTAVGVSAQDPAWTAQSVARAGAADGAGSLTGVFDVEVAPDGRLLVAQSSTATIAVFAPTGQYLRSLGRRGSGPGEFNVLGRLGWIADTLWVIDFGRIHLFNRELEFVRTIAPQLDPRPAALRMIAGPVMHDGSVVFFSVPTGGAGPAPITLATQQGQAIRTLGYEKDPRRSFRISFPNSQPVTLPDPWGSHSLWVHAADGRSLVVVNHADGAASRSFEVLRVALNGDTVMTTRVPFTPKPITRDVSDRAYTALAERLSDRGQTQAAVERALRDQVEFPRFAPPISDLVAGRDGTIWIRREDLRTESVEWLVLDPNGRPLGTLRLPSALDVMRVQSDRVWGVLKDELDIPFVVTYSVRSNARR